MGGNNANLLEEIKSTKKNISISSEAILTAISSFTNQYNNFLTLAEQLENNFKQIGVREVAVEQLALEMKRKTQQLEERERKCVERENELEVRDKIVSGREEKWIATERRMDQNAAKLPSIINLNVGGPRFSVPKENLVIYKGSLFEQMIVTNHSQQLPSGEYVFLDIFKYFSLITYSINQSIQDIS